jgi:hypothetical protein
MWAGSDSSHIAKVISQIGLENVTRRALLSATDTAVATLVEDYSKQVFTEQLSNVLKAAGAKAAGAIAASLGVGLIEAIWKQNDYVQAQLNRLIRQPLISGSRMANEAVNLPNDTDARRKFKEQRLNAAVDELFRAWGMLKDRETDTLDRFIIAKLQGLCFHQLEGGREMATKRLDEAIGILARKNNRSKRSYLNEIASWNNIGYKRYKLFVEKHLGDAKRLVETSGHEIIIQEHVKDLEILGREDHKNLFIRMTGGTLSDICIRILKPYSDIREMIQVLHEIRDN